MKKIIFLLLYFTSICSFGKTFEKETLDFGLGVSSCFGNSKCTSSGVGFDFFLTGKHFDFGIDFLFQNCETLEGKMKDYYMLFDVGYSFNLSNKAKIVIGGETGIFNADSGYKTCKYGNHTGYNEMKYCPVAIEHYYKNFCGGPYIKFYYRTNRKIGLYGKLSYLTKCGNDYNSFEKKGLCEMLNSPLSFREKNEIAFTLGIYIPI